MSMPIATSGNDGCDLSSPVVSLSDATVYSCSAILQNNTPSDLFFERNFIIIKHKYWTGIGINLVF